MCSLMYRRDSFDRFGDDLCEVILSYLSISDCFKLQCISKQFNAIIFNRQTTLCLTDEKRPYFRFKYRNSYIEQLYFKIYTRTPIRYYRRRFTYSLKYYLLEYVLKKCANITKLYIDTHEYNSDQIINLISNNCKCVKLLVMRGGLDTISTNCLKQLTENSLGNLESLSLSCIPNPEFINALMPFIPNLKRFTCDNFNNCEQSLISLLLQFKYRLNALNIGLTRIIDNEMVKAYIMETGYDPDLWIDDEFYTFPYDIMKQFASFEAEALQIFWCDFNYLEDYNSIRLLKLIGANCPQLKTLVVVSLLTPFYDVFSDGFQSLQTLCVKLPFKKQCENVELLKNCRKLRHLRFAYIMMNEICFHNIHVYLPQLESISVYCKNMDTTEFVSRKLREDFQKLPNLRYLAMNSFAPKHVLSFIANCAPIRLIVIYRRRIVANDKYDLQNNKINELIKNMGRKVDIVKIIARNQNFHFLDPKRTYI